MDFIKLELRPAGRALPQRLLELRPEILAALEKAAESDIMDVVYLTNFSCGPDSFLLSYAEEIIGNRPMLMLELTSTAPTRTT